VLLLRPVRAFTSLRRRGRVRLPTGGGPTGSASSRRCGSTGADHLQLLGLARVTLVAGV